MASGIRPRAPLIDKAVRSRFWRGSCRMAASISTRRGPSEISATVKAYFALKLAGLAVDDPRLARARERILALGGLQAANSYVKINLSLFDLYPREHCPSIPPEVMLLRQVHLPDVVVDARDRDSAVDRACARIRGGRCPPDSRSKSCSCRACSPTFRRDDEILHAGAISSCSIDQLPEVLGAARLAQPAPEGHPRGRAVDAGAHAVLRRAGRHLSAHDVRHHGARCAGLSGGSSGRAGSRSSSSIDLMVDDGRRLLLPALLLAGLGHGHRGLRAGRSRRSARSMRWRARPTGCSTKEVRRKGDWSREAAADASLPAGTSSSPTSSIPISTTPPWCCWR